MAGLLLAVCQVIAVEVPIKHGLTHVFQSFEEGLFYFLQHVEAHEDILFVFKFDVLILCHLSIESAFVGDSLN